MELTPEVNDLYRKLVTELQKFGKNHGGREKEPRFILKAAQPSPASIHVSSISSSILCRRFRLKAAG